MFKIGLHIDYLIDTITKDSFATFARCVYKNTIYWFKGHLTNKQILGHILGDVLQPDFLIEDSRELEEEFQTLNK